MGLVTGVGDMKPGIRKQISRRRAENGRFFVAKHGGLHIVRDHRKGFHYAHLRVTIPTHLLVSEPYPEPWQRFCAALAYYPEAVERLKRELGNS